MINDFRYTSYAQKVIFGAGALERLSDAMERFGCRHVMLCASGSARRNGQVTRMANALGARLVAIYDGVRPHVQDFQVTEALADAERNQIDAVIGFGGGSPIGMAKAVSFALEEKHKGRPSGAAIPADQPRIPVIAIPTTYAGSEMTPVYGITRHSDGIARKLTVNDARIAPRVIIYDPVLTLELPPELTASTGINALAHCVEAAYSITRNPLSSAAAFDGARYISRALPRCYTKRDDLEARTEMLIGSYLAGAALTNVAMGLHHGLCHVLGGTAGVPHGIANVSGRRASRSDFARRVVVGERRWRKRHESENEFWRKIILRTGGIRMAVNTMDYSAKPLMLDVVRTERDRFYKMIDDPHNWEVQTRCTEWQTRDIVGHMIDVTEGYLDRWNMAREKLSDAPVRGLLVMASGLDENAKTFRRFPREQAIERLKTQSDKMMTIFDSLTADEWGNFLVTHPYMGPLPTLFYPAFHVMDYGVHSWDIRWGLGSKDAPMDERAAGVLVPYMLNALLPATVDQNSAKGADFEIGVIVDGEWGGQWRIKVKDGQLNSAPAETLDGVPATIHFKNASDFVLTCFGRFPGGDASGDPQVIEKYRNLFFRI